MENTSDFFSLSTIFAVGFLFKIHSVSLRKLSSITGYKSALINGKL